MRCGHTSAGPRVLQFKGFLQFRLPRNGPRWALPLTHLATLPTGTLFSLNANKVVLTTLQHHSGLCILIFPLSYPHTLPEAQKAHHCSPNSQCLAGEDLWTWVEGVAYSPLWECHAAEICCGLGKKSSPSQGSPGLPAA